MKKWLILISLFFISSAVYAVIINGKSYGYLFNPFTGTQQYVTNIDTNSVQGSGVIITTITGGILITGGGGSGTPGGSDKQLQYNNGGLFAGENGSSVTSTGLVLYSTYVPNIPLIIVGTTSQTGDLTDWKILTTTKVFVDALGGVGVNADNALGITYLGGASDAPQYGGLWFGKTTHTSSNFTVLGQGANFYFNADGQLLFEVGAALKMQINAAHVDVLSGADFNVLDTASALYTMEVHPNDTSGQSNRLSSNFAAVIPLVVKATATQTADMQDWDVSTTTKAAMTPGGNILLNADNSLGNVFVGGASDGAQYGGIWVGQPTHTTNNYQFLGQTGATLFNAPSSVGQIYFSVNNNHKFFVDNGQVAIINGANFNVLDTAQDAYSFQSTPNSSSLQNKMLAVVPAATVLALQGALSSTLQSGNYLTVQDSNSVAMASIDSLGNFRSNIVNSGATVFLGAASDDPTYSGTWYGQPTHTTTNYSFLGKSGATYLNGTASLNFRISNQNEFALDGSFVYLGFGTNVEMINNVGDPCFITSMNSGTFQNKFLSTRVGATTLVLQSTASQTANMLTFQNNLGTVVSSVTAAGAFSIRPRTKAQLSTDVPEAPNLFYTCTDCTTDGLVMSTGTAAGSFSRATARTTVIN